MNWKIIIFNNLWAKLIALALAIATWFYVFDLVNTDLFLKKKKTVEEIFSRYEFSVKEVPVRPIFFGKLPKGYRVKFDEIKVNPSKISVFGPKDIVDGVDELETDKIDLSEHTRNVELRLGLHSDTKFLRIKDKVVSVYLPVECMEPAKAPK
jgi:YbbR domain-containing protein